MQAGGTVVSVFLLLFSNSSHGVFNVSGILTHMYTRVWSPEVEVGMTDHLISPPPIQ